MRTIKKCEVKKEIKELKMLLKNSKRINKNMRTILKFKGYTDIALGSGKRSKIKPLEIEEREFKGRDFLRGKYLVIGMASIWFGGVKYRGLVKKIVD